MRLVIAFAALLTAVVSIVAPAGCVWGDGPQASCHKSADDEAVGDLPVQHALAKLCAVICTATIANAPDFLVRRVWTAAFVAVVADQPEEARPELWPPPPRG